MHDPTCFDAIRSSISVKNECLSHPCDGTSPRIMNRAILASGFPGPRSRGSVGSVPSGVLAVPEAEEVPLVGVELCHLCERTQTCGVVW